MPLFDLICKGCGEKEIDVVIDFTPTIWNDTGVLLKESVEKTLWKCKKCGGKKYRRLPANIGGVVIR